MTDTRQDLIKMQENSKKELFETTPVPKALATMAIPTIISQMINLIYNMVDTFFIGRTGNSYMVAATTLTLTMVMMNVAFANLFGVGGGSLVARLMGARREEACKKVSAFAVYGGIALALTYSVLIGIFLDPVLRFLGASGETIGFARQYALLVIVIGSLPSILSQVLAHLLRNTGYSGKASIGLSSGGILNMLLDPLFMFVILPRGYEVMGAAAATLLSNIIACCYLLIAYRRASAVSPLGMNVRDAVSIEPQHRGSLFAVGVPSAILTGLFDVANICLNILTAAHNDLTLAAMGIVMKVERVPNAVNIGICQGMLPIVAYNYSCQNHSRMRNTIRTARLCGLAVSAASILLLFAFAEPVTNLFLSTSAGDSEAAVITIGLAAAFLRVRCLASPVQFINYHTSFCMQAMGKGKETMLHAFVRELVFYIPFMFLFDRLFGVYGLAAALPAGEACGAAFALFLLYRILRQNADAAGAAAFGQKADGAK